MKIPLSFKSDEEYIYNYIKSKFNYSAYIKELVVADMKKQQEANKPKKRGFDL